MGGRHGSAHYHTATLQMASITVECAELAVGALGAKMSNVYDPAANSAVIHSFTHDRHIHPFPCNAARGTKINSIMAKKYDCDRASANISDLVRVVLITVCASEQSTVAAEDQGRRQRVGCVNSVCAN